MHSAPSFTLYDSQRPLSEKNGRDALLPLQDDLIATDLKMFPGFPVGSVQVEASGRTLGGSRISDLAKFGVEYGKRLGKRLRETVSG